MLATSCERTVHALQVLTSLENMRSKGFICDFKVNVENQSFNTHRVLLAACSGYFEALFSSNMRETQDGYITMKDVRAQSIGQCIGYMYSGFCELKMDSIESTLRASNLLQLHDLEKKCFNFLQDNLKPDNCISILNLARAFDHQDAADVSEEFIIKNLLEVMQSELFKTISKQDLIRYISDANCEIKWEAVTTWSDSRQNDFEELVMKQVEFSDFSFSYLFDEVFQYPLVRKSDEITELVVNALFSDTNRLEESLDPQNCYILKKLATDEDSKNVIEAYMKRNFSIIISNPLFCDLTKGEVTPLILGAVVQSQKLKWEAVTKWATSLDQRQGDFEEVVKLMDFSKFSLNYLINEVLQHPFVRKSDEISGFVINALFSDLHRLEKGLERNNCYILKKLASDEGSKKVIKLYMERNFCIIILDSMFCHLTKEDVISLLRGASVQLEKFKWKAILKWVRFAEDSRKADFCDLFCTINLNCLPLPFLDVAVRKEKLVTQCCQCMNLLMDETFGNAMQFFFVERQRQQVIMSSVFELRQPPNGNMSESLDPRNTCKVFEFTFEAGKYKGIQYPKAQFRGYVPLRYLDSVEDSIKEAFESRAIFKLKFKQNSKSGAIDWGNIHLITEHDRAMMCISYRSNLIQELQQHGFW